jgi:glycosyltransferase involved in cell wall biosynthesis
VSSSACWCPDEALVSQKMSKPLKHLLMTTLEDAYHPGSWSGIVYSLRLALERKVERVSVFQPGRPKRTPLNVAKRLWYGGDPPRYPLSLTKAALKQTAKEVQREISGLHPDAVLSISSQCVAFVDRPEIPIFTFSDAPWMTWHQAYERWDPLPVNGVEFAAIEAQAARRIDGSCFGSRWACDEAERLYSADGVSLRKKIHMTPLGANWVPTLTNEELLAAIAARERDQIELLYVGKDWERKGGPMAVAVAELLHAVGHKVRLHLVGCRPVLPAEMTGPDGFITVYGTLDRWDAEQNTQLKELFLRSHFLLVPTIAECFGIVFAEAQAYGLPPLSRSVHALPSVVLDGETGFLFDREAPAGAYVEKILALMADRDAYTKMARRGREYFEQTLNWDKTAEEIVRLIAERLGSAEAG